MRFKNFNIIIDIIIQELMDFDKIKYKDNLYHLDNRYKYGKYLFDRFNNIEFPPPINMNGYLKDDKDLDNTKYIQFLNLKELRYCLMCEMVRYVDKQFEVETVSNGI